MPPATCATIAQPRCNKAQPSRNQPIFNPRNRATIPLRGGKWLRPSIHNPRCRSGAYAFGFARRRFALAATGADLLQARWRPNLPRRRLSDQEMAQYRSGRDNLLILEVE
jgi:hypothetical protein